jgi:hypothetical protein
MKDTLSKRKNNPEKAHDLPPDEKFDEMLKVVYTTDNMSIVGNWTEIDDELVLDYHDQLLKKISRRKIKD